MKKRENFSNAIIVFFATLSSAVGLGNIWKFPSEVGLGGGGAFLLVYLVCLLLIGVPILLAEFILGKSSKSNAVSIVEELKVAKFWKSIGYLGMICGFVIMFFYSSIAGLVYSYIFKPIFGSFSDPTASNVAQTFELASTNSFSVIAWQVIVVVIVCAITIAGVKKGIERFTKVLMPILLSLLIILVVVSLTLSGATQGISFLFKPDFSKITTGVILSAMGLAFFKLSLGMGTMMTYASYFKKDISILRTARNLVLADLIVSLLAGLAIFPALFTFFPELVSAESGAIGGPVLLFITIPMVFSQIPLGSVLITAFFILSSIAATTAMISMLAVPTAILTERTKYSKNKVTILAGIIIIVFGSLASLSISGDSLLGNVSIFGMTIFDFYDFISSKILMPIGGILIAILVGCYLNSNTVKEMVGEIDGLVVNTLKFISLTAIVIVFVTSLFL